MEVMLEPKFERGTHEDTRIPERWGDLTYLLCVGSRRLGAERATS